MMNRLNRNQQELILDFYFQCGREEDIERGRDLIAVNPEAAKLYEKLEETLGGLDHLYEPCPENLVDLTVARLKIAASARRENPSRLEELLQQEQSVPFSAAKTTETPGGSESQLPKPTFKLHQRFGELLAAAAAILLIFSILFPSAGYMRQQYYKITCADSLRQIGQAFSTFASDHNDQMTQSVIPAGAPWWKIGYQGPETHSNTRVPWQLVKQGYVKGKVFVCRGNADAEAVRYDPEEMGCLRDFPRRRNISYSFILFCDKTRGDLQRHRKVIAGDVNPVFQQIPNCENSYDQLNEFEKILLNKQLREMLSPSHKGRGQNILHGDTSVEWVEVRVINNDDIYTIKGVDEYRGKEMPQHENDTFLIP